MSIRPLLLIALPCVLVGCAVDSSPGSDEPADPVSAEPVEIGTRYHFRSTLLNEDRSVLVWLPASHETSTFRYPVLYVLDGSSDFLQAAALVEFLARTDRIPEMIVVGIENTNRSRDLTPPSSNDQETAFWDETGGADQFRSFLRDELFPLIEGRFRTAPYRVLRGQSFGGLLAIHDYLGPDPLFSAYITSSAAVGWNHGELIERGPMALRGGIGRPLYLSAGGRDFAATVEANQAFAGMLGANAGPTDRWKLEMYPDEGHYSLAQESTRNGLRWLYEDWQVPDSVAALADLSAIERHYTRLSADFAYTIKVPMASVIRLGNDLLRRQRFDKGIEVLRANLEWYPDQPESHWHVGDALVLAGRADEARPYFEQALEKAIALGVPADEYRLEGEGRP